MPCDRLKINTSIANRIHLGLLKRSTSSKSSCNSCSLKNSYIESLLNRLERLEFLEEYSASLEKYSNRLYRSNFSKDNVIRNLTDRLSPDGNDGSSLPSRRSRRSIDRYSDSNSNTSHSTIRDSPRVGSVPPVSISLTPSVPSPVLSSPLVDLSSSFVNLSSPPSNPGLPLSRSQGVSVVRYLNGVPYSTFYLTNGIIVEQSYTPVSNNLSGSTRLRNGYSPSSFSSGDESDSVSPNGFRAVYHP